MSLFDFLKKIQAAGVDMLARGALNFAAPFLVNDDGPTKNSLTVSMPNAGGGSAGLMTNADKAFLDSIHASPTALGDTSETLLWSTSPRYNLPASTLTTSRTKTLGVSDTPPIGALIGFESFFQGQSLVFANGGGGGGSWTLTPAQSGAYVFRFDGTNWAPFSPITNYALSTSTYSGLMSSTQFSQLANLVTTPVVSFSSGSPTLTLSANAPETLFYLSGTVSAPKLPPAGSNIGLRAIVKCENLSGCAVTADTGNPDLIDGSATYTVPGSYGSASYHFKATGIVRAFPGLT